MRTHLLIVFLALGTPLASAAQPCASLGKFSMPGHRVVIRQAKETAATSSVTLPEGGMDLDAFVANIERELIQRSLERTNGNKGQAARLLNLKRTTLVEKLKRLHK